MTSLSLSTLFHTCSRDVILSQPDVCFHCGLPADVAIRAQLNGETRIFCCGGCQAVAEVIVGGGLGDFYGHREGHNTKPQARADFAAFDMASVQEDFVHQYDEQHKQADLYLSGISCAACVWLIEKHLQRLAGVQAVRVNAGTYRASVVFNPSIILLSNIMRALANIGFEPQPLVGQAEQEHWLKEQREYLLRLGVAGIGMMQVGMVAVALHAGDIQGMESHWVPVLRWVTMLLTLPVLLYSAQPFFAAAIRALRVRRFVMDISVSIALLLAFSASTYATFTDSGEVYFDSVCMFTFFLLLGRYLEKRARYQNFKASAQFSALLPLTVERWQDGGTVQVPLKHISPGEQLQVRPGEVFPCDGLVTDGCSEADEALLTGESTPVAKAPGDRVLAGTHNGSTALRIMVTATGLDTEFATIEKLVQQAEFSRPRQVALADQIAAKFGSSVLALAAVTGAVWYTIDPAKALWVSLSVLVVTCPCALSLATPTVLTAAINRLRAYGVLVTNGEVLETLNRLDSVVMDKTGTLTNGALHVEEVRCLDEAISQQDVLAIAAALEAGSSHPIAKAFESYLDHRTASRRAAQIGAGVSAYVEGRCYRLGSPGYAYPLQSYVYPSSGLWLLLADDRQALAWLRLREQVRPTARACIDGFKSLGIRTALLSGDRGENVQQVAQALAVDDWRGEMLPGDKLEYVRSLQTQGRTVLMVGDGINDLPVLSGADVSCAMGSATQLAQTKADCVLLGEDLTQLPRALKLARAVKRTIVQNLAWAFAYNIIALPLAVAGLVPPWLAALGMSASSLVVVLNALRVR